MAMEYSINSMKIGTGRWYAPRYSGRKVPLYRIKHIVGNEIIMEIWEFDKKTRKITPVDKYVPVDTDFFENKSQAESILPIEGEFREELDLPDLGELEQ